MVDEKDDNENKIVHYRIDVLWHYIEKIIVPGTCNKRFKLPLFLYPYSNTGLEELFSVVRKNKTDTRSSLKLDGTLSSILTTKTYSRESLNLCYKWRTDEDLLDLSEKTTRAYKNEQTQK